MLCVSCPRFTKDRIKGFRSKCERLLDCRVECFRHRDRFQLHECRKLLPEWQCTEFLSQLCFCIGIRGPRLWSRRSHLVGYSVSAYLVGGVLIDGEEATLKRFRRRGASIALEPANTAYEVRILPPNRVRIQGKLVGLFRRY